MTITIYPDGHSIQQGTPEELARLVFEMQALQTLQSFRNMVEAIQAEMEKQQKQKEVAATIPEAPKKRQPKRKAKPMVKPEPWENPMLDTMWHFMEMGGLKANYPALKEACMEMRQMIMQKTAGQRKDRPKDIPWENWERVKVTIVCEAMALVLSGEYEPKEESKSERKTAG